MKLYKLLIQADEEDREAMRILYFGLNRISKELFKLQHELLDISPSSAEKVKSLYGQLSSLHFIIQNWWELYIEEQKK